MPFPRKKSEAETGQDAWMSPATAAAALGKSRLWLYEQALNGDVRHAKVAGRRVFARDDVERLMPTMPAAVAA